MADVNTKTSQYMPPGSEKELLLAWVRRTRESQMGHYQMASIASSRAKCFGVSVIVATTIVGTSVFSSILAEMIPAWAKLIVGFLSVFAAIMSSLQTFFGFSDQSTRHETAAIRYGCLRRKLEAEYAQGSSVIDANYIEARRHEIDRLAEESPHVPASVFPRIQKNVHFVASEQEVNCGRHSQQ